MRPQPDWTEEFGKALATARREGNLAGLRQDRVMTLEQAEAIQSAALKAYGGSAAGDTLRGTSVLSRRRFNCDAPFFGRMLDIDLASNDATVRLPHGVLGAGRCFMFAAGRTYPEPGESIDRATALDAVADCRIAIEVVGRRVAGGVPLNAFTAVSDFALNVVIMEGAHVRNFADADLLDTKVTARINDNTVATGRGRDVMEHPLEAVAWLARQLEQRRRTLEVGDLVSTGSCAGILQVMPGQVFEADFGPLGSVRAVFA